MSYIGRGTDKISNIEILDNITFDGSSSYSITKSSVAFVPNSAQSLLISIDGVVQATNFTISGSTIDFGVAVPSTSTCNFFLHYGTGVLFTPADGTVTEAKIGSNAVSTAKIVDASVTSAKLGSDVTQGITEADQWRLATTLSNPSEGAYITANLERVDDASFAKIGTGMTESSGVFTFPTTGLYLVKIKAVTSQVNNSSANIYMNVSTNSGGAYDQVARIIQGEGNSSTSYDTGIAEALVNVTDASTFRVAFQVFTLASGTVAGNTAYTVTGFTFIRLGDSQ
jgi:hypothetical protein